MGVHYAIRLKDVVIDISGYNHPENIIKWLKSSNSNSDDFEKYLGPSELDITKEIKYLPMIIYNYENTFDFTDLTKVKVDMFICYKNASADAAIFIMWLKTIIVQGDVYYSDDNEDFKIDLSKRIECEMEPSGTIEYYIPQVPEEDLTDEDKNILPSEDVYTCLGAR